MVVAFFKCHHNSSLVGKWKSHDRGGTGIPSQKFQRRFNSMTMIAHLNTFVSSITITVEVKGTYTLKGMPTQLDRTNIKVLHTKSNSSQNSSDMLRFGCAYGSSSRPSKASKSS